MNRELHERLYLRNDIDRAYNMGMDAAIAVFEKSLGLPIENQKHILKIMKDKLHEDKAGVVMNQR